MDSVDCKCIYEDIYDPLFVKVYIKWNFVNVRCEFVKYEYKCLCDHKCVIFYSWIWWLWEFEAMIVSMCTYLYVYVYVSVRWGHLMWIECVCKVVKERSWHA